MSAFEPWSDEIERSQPGQPYVVDSSGWGWFMLLYLIALPFVVLSFLIADFAEWYTDHPVLCLNIYYLFACIIGFIFYRNQTCKHRILGVISTLLTMAPLAGFMTGYAIPFIILDPGFDAFFDFILILLLLSGGMIFIFRLCGVLKSGLAHLIMALIFLGLSFLLFQVAIGTERDLLTPDAVWALYR